MTFKAAAPWHSERALSTFVVLVCLALQTSLHPFEGLERLFYEFAQTLSLPQPGISPAATAPQAQESALGNAVTFFMTGLVIFFSIYVLPGLTVARSTLINLCLLVALVLGELAAFVTMGLWLKLTFPACLVALVFAFQWMHRVLQRPAPSKPANAPPAQSQRMMALALQGQGQLDMAFEHFQRTAINDTVAGDLYCLAQEFERKSQVDKAISVYRHIASHKPDFKDVKDRMNAVSPQAAATHYISPIKASAPPANHTSQKTSGQAKFLGRYKIEKPLGKGAMGTVYLGNDAKIGRPVALKTMSLSQEFDGLELVDARERFFREAKAAGRLQHPGIVTIFDVGEENEIAYIAMEYLSGQDLQTYCKPETRLPVSRVLSIVSRLALALAYAHRLQVIHRDIKPGNVMYDLATDIVKVTDFGIARITDGNKTRTGVILGSPSYMAPEQLAGRPLDGRSDLYALGVMLFQLLTSTLPFRAGSLAELMSKIAHEPAPDVRQFNVEIHEDLARIVARLLEKLPQNRYQDGESLSHDLSGFAERVQLQMASVSAMKQPRLDSSASAPLDLEL